MKTSRLVLAPAVAVALTGLAGAPAFAETSSPATVSPTEVCAQEEQQSSDDSESDSSVPDESDPQATLAQAQVTRDDIADQKKGIGFSGTGFTPDEKATVTVVGTDGTEYAPEKKLTVDEKGEVSGTYFFSVTEGAKVPVGKYSLYLTDLKSEKKSSKVSFEVVSKASDVDNPGNDDTPGNNDDKNCDSTTAPADNGDDATESESPSPSETGTEKPSESNTPSPTETDDKSDDNSDDKSDDKSSESPVKGVNPGPAKKPTTEAPKPTKTDDAKDADNEDSDKAEDADDKTSEAPTTSEAPKPTETDDADASKDSEDTDKSDDTKRKASEDDDSKSDDEKSEDSTTDEKSEDKASESTGPASPGSDEKKAPAAAKQSLFIDPTEISSEDFLNKGIKLGVSGAQPGEKITITVEHAQGKVDRYTMTKEADSEGKATFGVQAKVKAVLGTYNVTAQAESFDEPQGGSFTVLTNGTAVDDGGNGSGSNGAGNGSDSSGSDLPRTGAEMTGLALGVGLLAVGAAAVIITRRRMNATDDPAEF